MRRALAIGVALATASGSAAVDQSAVEILTRPVEVVHKTYDAEHPTADMPPLIPPEVGLCISEFGCEVRLRTSGSEDRPASRMVDGIRITTRLHITIWTRVLAPARETEHEEAHRAISEYYYREAGVIARQLAERVVGRREDERPTRGPRPGRDGEEQARDLGATVQDSLVEAYLAQTHWRAAFAQVCFDDVTDHGRKSIAVSDAVAEAIAEENQHAVQGRAE